MKKYVCIDDISWYNAVGFPNNKVALRSELEQNARPLSEILESEGLGNRVSALGNLPSKSKTTAVAHFVEPDKEDLGVEMVSGEGGKVTENGSEMAKKEVESSAKTVKKLADSSAKTVKKAADSSAAETQNEAKKDPQNTSPKG